MKLKSPCRRHETAVAASAVRTPSACHRGARRATTGLAIMGLSLLGSVASSKAANGTDTWTGTSSDFWSVAGNWTGTNKPPISGDALSFNAAGSGGTTLTDDLTTGVGYMSDGVTPNFAIASITFNTNSWVINPSSSSNGFTLTGSITNGSSAKTQTIADSIMLSSGATHTVSTPVSTYTGTFTADPSSPSAVTLSGNISGDSTANLTLARNGGTAGTNTVSIINLNGNNSYGGTTFLSSGSQGMAVNINGTNSGGGAYTYDNGQNQPQAFNINSSGTVVAASFSMTNGTANSRYMASLNLNSGTLQLNTSLSNVATFNLNFNGGTLLNSSSGGLSITGYTGSSGTGPTAITVGLNGATFDTGGSAAGNMTNAQTSKPITSTVGGAITVQGSNTLLSAVSTTGLLTISSTSSTSASLDITSSSNTVNSQAGGLTGGGTILNSATGTNSARTLSIVGAGTNDFSGAIAPVTTSNIALTINMIGGSQTLSGTNTYTGATTITSGTLLVNGSLANTAVAVNAGTLGGMGSIAGKVTLASGATLMGGVPGTASGALTLTTAPALSSGILELVLGANNAHSSLVLPTAATFNAFSPTQSVTLDNIQDGTYNDIIANVASGINASAWSVTNGSGYTITFSDDGSNIDLMISGGPAVPEPSTVVAGLLLAGAFGWRQRRSACD